MDLNAGGYSETIVASEDIKKICNEMKDDVEKRTGKTYAYCEALQFRKRDDGKSGTTFIIKVRVGGDNYLHLKILQNTDKKSILLDLQMGLKKDSPIIPF